MGILLLGTNPVYEGLVASRARMVTSLDTVNKQIMGRWGCISTEPLTSVRLALGNFLSNGSSDAGGGTGATSTVTASIEYAGFNQVKLAGASSFTIASGDLVFTDYVTLITPIPTGTIFWVRQFITNTGGVLYYPFQNSFFSEATVAAVSGLADQTMSGTIANTYNAGNPQLAGLPPLAVLGMTTNPSVIVVGDSICVQGTEDTSATITGVNGKVGLITPSLGSVPFLSLAMSGETANTWTTRATARKKMVPKGSHLINQTGVNDLGTQRRTSAQIIPDLQAIAALARANQKIYQTTITPNSRDVSGSPYTTTVNQSTVLADGFEHKPEHVALNQAIRAGISGYTGYYDASSVLESALDSDLWTITPAPPYTGDGLHPNQTGFDKVKNANVIGPITWP